MTIQHVVRRGTAMAAGGALVLGAGSAVGLVTGRMQRDWAAAEQRDAAASQAAAAAAQQVDLSPVVVHEVVVRHVTPDPVVVHRTVTRHVVRRPSTQAVRATGTPRAPRVRRPAASSRTVVAPAPRPVPARHKAPSATTSKTS